jgi:transcription elongation GreA/GreB family factor
MKEGLKQKVYDYCRVQVMKKIEASNAEIKALQNSANEETKSSAGDKYETGRAMAQLEIEKYSSQLAELSNQLSALNKIRIESTHTVAGFGSMVETSLFIYFISISVGEVSVDGSKVLVISPSSPIAKKLLGLKSGDSFDFNNRTIKILKIN